ncbi:RidA family protein [Paracoccaceae bacterium]|nr:RidA family protein [Paracoccaceae bacterium]MBT6546208.1 RidA family protein [Paracoccaceae bacterium]MDB3910970.1 RidA family protein [Paracoccaceae bacterium]HBS40300.1 enamine deaminase RidA [Paracoccaceae bacterium]
MRHKTIYPEGWKPAKGYANGVLATGATLHIAGQIGWNAEKKFTSDEFIGQMEQALLNIRTVLEAAGGTAQDLTRLTWYITDKRDYTSKQKQVGAVYRKIMGTTFPAMTMVVVAGLVEDEALVEIEATAMIET